MAYTIMINEEQRVALLDLIKKSGVDPAPTKNTPEAPLEY